MSQSTSETGSGQKKSLFEKISEIIIDLISNIPTSSEPHSDDPKKRAKIIVLQASSKAALVSGGLSLPPGPMGMLTILPDIMAIWHIQRQMVADIAAVYGKSKQLGKEEMLYCLFKHLASQVLRDVVVRVGERMLVRRTSLKFIQEMLKKIGVRITQRIAGRGISRWIPIVGAIGIGAYAFYDTAQVGETAIDLFEREIDTEEGGSL
jgi:hypothetical protein